jgi:hypothetical protein
VAIAAAVFLYRSVSYVQSDVSGFGDPLTGKTFAHVRVNRKYLIVGLALGVVSAFL